MTKTERVAAVTDGIALANSEMNKGNPEKYCTSTAACSSRRRRLKGRKSMKSGWKLSVKKLKELAMSDF